MGRGQPRDQRGALRPPPRAPHGHVKDRRLYAQDLYIGAHEAHRRSLRVYTETAWASIFARNLFRPAAARGPRDASCPTSRSSTCPASRPTPRPRAPAPGTAILLHLKRMEIIIVGTKYAGEIKKSAFTVMNYLMPDEGVFPMHSSINVGERGDACIFFGLQRDRQDDALRGPAAEPDRRRRARLGRRLHVQLRGRLLRQDDPPVRRCTSRTSSRRRSASGRSSRTSTSTRETRELDLDSRAVHREHPRRVPAPLHRQRRPDRRSRPGPRNVVFLTADAFGVLPPISRLTREQAAYHFISGYTAKLAGTEIGVKEPTATFSAGFGAPFLPRHPGEYARHADGPPRAVRRPGLAGEHRLDGRPVRHRAPDEHHPHPEHGPGGDQRRARRRGDGRRPGVPDRGPGPRAGRPGRGPRPARHVGRQGRLRRDGPPARGDVPPELRARTPTACPRRSARRARSRSTRPGVTLDTGVAAG